MYDDLDDLLPKRQTAPDDNPFANPFNATRSNSLDPWSTFPQGNLAASTGGFGDDDWNRNAFADHVSPFSRSEYPHDDAEEFTDPEVSSPAITTPVQEAPPTPTREVHALVNHSPTPPVSAPLPVTSVDPLDAAASNVEEEEAHIPVIRRKLPVVAALPTQPAPEESKPEPPAPASPTTAPSRTETPQKPVETKEGSDAPTKDDAVISPTLSTPTKVEQALPSETADSTPPARQPPSPSSSPAHLRDPSTPSPRSSGFSEANEASSGAPSEAPSNVIISPLETPSRSPVTNLSRNISAVPISADHGWGASSGWGSSTFNDYVPPPPSHATDESTTDEQPPIPVPTVPTEEESDDVRWVKLSFFENDSDALATAG